MSKEGDKEKSLPIIESVERNGYTEIRVNNKVFLRDEAREFKKITDEEFGKNTHKFMVNFKSCQYISSEGLGCVADFWRKCSEDQGIAMVALFENEPVNELLNFFEIIGLARVMEDHIFMEIKPAEEFLANFIE